MSFKHYGHPEAPVILNDADDDGTPHWKYRVDVRDMWSAQSFATYAEAQDARIAAIALEVAGP